MRDLRLDHLKLDFEDIRDPHNPIFEECIEEIVDFSTFTHEIPEHLELVVPRGVIHDKN